MIEPSHPDLSIRRQCELIGLNRSSYYYEPAGESEFNLHLMRLMDEQYLRTPFYGWPRMTAYLQRKGYAVNHKRVQRLMRIMDLQAIYPKRKAGVAGQGNKIYPYLLRGLEITQPNQVRSADITYVPMQHGFMYLVAILELVQSLCAGLATVQHLGWPVLPGGASASAPAGPTGYLQHRPRRAVHGPGVHPPSRSR